MTNPEIRKKKIAVLGGGMSALAAVFNITKQPDWQNYYDITVYQMGWRLGGKCATGRNMEPGKHLRIEEHGIHGFLGCYYNALHMMRECYEELNRPKDAKLATFGQAFQPRNTVLRYEFINGQMMKWPIILPATSDSAATIPLKDFGKYSSVGGWIFQAVKGLTSNLEYNLLRTYYLDIVTDPETGIPIMIPGTDKPAMGPGKIRPGVQKVNTTIKQMLAKLAPDKDDKGNPLPPEKQLEEYEQDADYIRKQAESLQSQSVHLLTRDDQNRIRRLSLMCQYLAVLIKGTLKDNVAEEGFEKINEFDFASWLKKHGANQEAINSPLSLSTPNISYQYKDGDTSLPPTMAAGAYLQWSLRTFSYLGHFIYLFAAGTGDTAIAPLYEVLKKRGVKFKFFHEVTGLRLGSSGDEIEHIDFNIQATPEDPKGYEPLIDAVGLPSWPAKPLFDQLTEGEDIKETIGTSRADLESPWCRWRGKKATITKGADDGFDEILMGISVSALKDICKDLTRYSKDFANALEYSSTVPTQAMQIWLTPKAEEMGWVDVLPRKEPLLSANYLAPPNGQADFSEYLKFESWTGDHKPETCLYICGTLPMGKKPDGIDGAAFTDKMTERANAQSIQYLQAGLGGIYPEATVATTGVGDPMSLDFELLFVSKENENLKGVDRFQDQYWRANVSPSEQYVTTLPGSTKYRLKPTTDFTNLYVTGDWINTGLNVGSVEGAVMGGLLTSHAICGKPEIKDIIGYFPEPADPSTNQV